MDLPEVRTLVLMRHAKSDHPIGVSDHDRPLTDRGRVDAAAARSWLDSHHLHFDETLCSTALRSRQTVEAMGMDAPIRLAAEIYEADPEDILEQISVTSDAAQTLLVIGHSPGMPSLAVGLAGPGSDPQALAALNSRFPTAALVVLRIKSQWSDLDFGNAVLLAFHMKDN